MRSPAILGGLALVLAAIALVISFISLFRAAAPGTGSVGAGPNLISRLTPCRWWSRPLTVMTPTAARPPLTTTIPPDSVDGRWYVFMYDENNVRIAHPTVKSLLGKPVDGPTGVDINGYAYGKDMVKTTEAGQWVSYVFLNPSTGREEVKHTLAQEARRPDFRLRLVRGQPPGTAQVEPHRLHRFPGAAGPPPLRPARPGRHHRLLQHPGKAWMASGTSLSSTRTTCWSAAPTWNGWGRTLRGDLGVDRHRLPLWRLHHGRHRGTATG